MIRHISRNLAIFQCQGCGKRLFFNPNTITDELPLCKECIAAVDEVLLEEKNFLKTKTSFFRIIE